MNNSEMTKSKPENPAFPLKKTPKTGRNDTFI